jgi:Ca2+/Na+ antiporter
MHKESVFVPIVLDDVLSVSFLVSGTSVEKRSLTRNVYFVFLSAFTLTFFHLGRT